MRISPAVVKGCFAALLLSLPGMVVGLPERGAAAPAPEAVMVRLTNQVEIGVPGVQIDHAALLPDNETVVVVGGKPKPGDLDDKDWIIGDAPAAGALVNLKTKKVRPFTNGHTTRINSVAFSAEGSCVVTVCSNKDPMIRFWDIKAGKNLSPTHLPKLEADYYPRYEVACFGGSRMMAVGLKGSVTLLDPADSEKKVELKTELLSEVTPDNLVISPDDKLVGCSTLDKDVVVWDVKSRKVICSPRLMPDKAKRLDWSISSICFTKDGKRLVVVRNGNEDQVPKGTPEEDVKLEQRGLFLIDVAKQQVTPLGMGHQIYTYSFAFSPSEELLATGGASRPDKPDQKGLPLSVGELRLYHFPTRTLVLRVQFDDFFPTWVWFAPEGKKLVAVDRGGKVRVWDFTVTKR